ncbi:hypothetical protein ACU8KH_06483 [Lachancea thermotolerans]
MKNQSSKKILEKYKILLEIPNLKSLKYAGGLKAHFPLSGPVYHVSVRSCCQISSYPVLFSTLPSTWCSLSISPDAFFLSALMFLQYLLFLLLLDLLASSNSSNEMPESHHLK